MPEICPFCGHENQSVTLVCGCCGRDIAIPPSLIAERDDLVRKRDIAREELLSTRAELEQLRRSAKHRSS